MLNQQPRNFQSPNYLKLPTTEFAICKWHINKLEHNVSTFSVSVADLMGSTNASTRNAACLGAAAGKLRLRGENPTHPSRAGVSSVTSNPPETWPVVIGLERLYFGLPAEIPGTIETWVVEDSWSWNQASKPYCVRTAQYSVMNNSSAKLYNSNCNCREVTIHHLSNNFSIGVFESRS